MKNLFKNLMLVAVAAMGFTACEQVGIESVTPVLPEVEMTVIAGMDDTRTYIDETNKVVKWSDGDQLKVLESSTAGISYATTKSISIENDKALFGVSFDETAGAVTYNAFYPATAVVEDETAKRDIAKVKVSVKDQQNATATSFDPAADVLVAKQLEFDAQPTELNMQFKRLVSLGKLTLKNLPADAKIEKVIFTAGADYVLAGRNYVDATTGEVSQYGYFGATNALTINYSEAISTRDIYFTCNPFEMVAGEIFTVKAVCGNKSYTREVEIPADRSLKFTEGNLGTFSVDMASATVENISAFAEGQYAVIAKSGSKYYAMKGVKGSGNYMTYAEVNYDGTATTFTTEDDTLVWNIKAVDGGYTIQNHEDKYLYGSSSGNYAYLGNAQTLTLTLVDGTTMQYKVGVKDNAERILAFNENSGQERFAFYKGTQVNNLFLVPVAEDTTPRFTVDKTALQFAAEGGSQEITVTVVNTTDTIAATVDNSHFTVALKSGTTYTVTAPANETDGAIEGNLTFTAGELTATVALTQAAKQAEGTEGEDTPKFVKVTSAPSDWSGTYLIVYEDTKLAFDGSLAKLDAVSNTKSVTISNGDIAVTDEMKKIAFTIAKSGSNYTIKSASGYYIGQTSDANGMKTNKTTSYAHTISINADGSVNLVSGGAYLRYNAAKDQLRFRYYKSSSYSGQKAIQLYKLSE